MTALLSQMIRPSPLPELKYEGKNIIHTKHVKYIVKPIYFASLKFLGNFRVLNAITVHKIMRNILYVNNVAKISLPIEHSINNDSALSISRVTGSGGVGKNEMSENKSWTVIRPTAIRTCDVGLISIGFPADFRAVLKIR